MLYFSILPKCVCCVSLKIFASVFIKRDYSIAFLSFVFFLYNLGQILYQGPWWKEFKVFSSFSVLWSSLTILELHVPWHANVIHLWNFPDTFECEQGRPCCSFFHLVWTEPWVSAGVALLLLPCHRKPWLWFGRRPQYLISSLNLSHLSCKACSPQFMGLGQCRTFRGTLGETSISPPPKRVGSFGDPYARSTPRILQPRIWSLSDSNHFPVTYSLSFIFG